MMNPENETPPETAPSAPQQQPPSDLSPAECATLLASRFPAVFGKDVHRPLKLRIAADIQARVPDTFSKRALSAFLHRHTTHTLYLKALAEATHRFDLDGAQAGELSAEHRQAAVAELQRRRAVQQQRRTQIIESQRKAEHARREAEYTQREAEGQQRVERARLLRTFETSTLTRANFCALMGVDDAALDGLLAQAREERQRRSVPAATKPAAAPKPRRAAQR